MAEFITIIVIILIICMGFYLLDRGIDNESFIMTFVGYILLVCSIIIGVGVYSLLKDNSDDKTNVPQAIDVYRGETTLEITYRDSVPIDTVVVFKQYKL